MRLIISISKYPDKWTNFERDVKRKTKIWNKIVSKINYAENDVTFYTKYLYRKINNPLIYFRRRARRYSTHICPIRVKIKTVFRFYFRRKYTRLF